MTKKAVGSFARSTFSLPIMVLLLLGCFVLLSFTLSRSQVYAAPPITPSGLNTQVADPVTVNGMTQYDITGGTRPGGGANLFHSFGDFSVPTNNIANFLNAGSINPANPSITLPAGLPTSNILGRVTAGNPSIIFGMIQSNGTNGFGNANLFLMNPAGFLFGPNATVNVGGMVAFTTADYLRLEGIGGNGTFYADTAQTSVLTSAPVAAFGFLGSNPAAIALQGSTLTVAPSKSISLVGGDRGFEYTDPDTGIKAPASVPGGVTMTGGTLSASGGQINLASVASVASPGEVSAVDFMPTSGMTMGNISLSQGALLDVSADAAGTVRIRGGQFVMDNATLSADTGPSHGALLAVDIAVTGDLSISSNQAPAITARATDAGNAGEIRVAATKLDASFGFPDNIALIDSHTSGTGNAGPVTLTADQLTAALNLPSPLGFFIHTGTGGGGNGGDVTIKVGSGEFRAASIYTGDQLLSGTGNAGSLTVTGQHSMADSLHIDGLIDGVILGITWSTDSLSAKGGAMTVEAHDIQMRNSAFMSNISLLGDNPLTIRADRLVMDNRVQIISSTALGEGGGITFTGNIFELTNASTFLSQTFGDAPAGPIRVNATERVLVADDPSKADTPSGLLTQSFGDAGLGTLGKGGDIEVTTKVLDIQGGARFNATTNSGGNGGNVFIHAQSVSISGEFPSDPSTDFLGLGGTRASGIYTRTVGSDFCGGPCGNGGDTTINTGSFSLLNGAVLNNGTTNSGQAGTITVNATDQIVISGTLSDGRPGGIFSRSIGSNSDAGVGGNIALTASQSVTISDGATVSASSTGPGNTGNIQINAGNQFAMTNSSVTTEANQASGGAIKITTTSSGTVELTDSTISASVLDGMGGGGSVNIDPQFVILQNSQILAQAKQGPGGNISITANLLLPDANSVISASSEFGVNGTVTIQSPNAPGSGQVQPLGKTPLQATSLLNQHCAALAGGEFSSFTVAGRDSLPVEPGNWLTSPLALASTGFSAGTVAEAGAQPRVVEPARKITLSLRQIAPPGFLTQAFAGDRLAGCQS